MTYTYGVISDIHSIDIDVVALAIKVLKEKDADALVFNGDIIGERSGHNPRDYLATVLDIAGKSGLETYVLPGSHEVTTLYAPAIIHFSDKYQNIIDTFRHPKIEKKDHHIVFLQGSDWRQNEAVKHGYSLETENESGVYWNEGSYICVINMGELKKLVSDPEKTVVFSHIPRRFDNPETSIDTAEFWEVKKEFMLNGEIIEVGTIWPGPVGYDLANQGAPIKLKRENRGNENLRSLFLELGVTKNVTGHFHESCGRANDTESRPVEEGLFVPKLFYNASCLDRLMVGMVSVEGDKASYENIDLKRYLE